jgi:hypothetical protein
MAKFKEGDIVIIKDDFLKSFEIIPNEIGESITEGSQKQFGDYYVSDAVYSTPRLEKDLITIDSLGTMDIYVSDIEYYSLRDFFRENGITLNSNFDQYHYCDCNISFFRPQGGYTIRCKLMAGNMSNLIHLGLAMGRHLESQREQIEKAEIESQETRRLQDNEHAKSNDDWNNDQENHSKLYEGFDRENQMRNDDEYNSRNWEGRD